MAYVGTPKNLDDPVTTLASILQGESSTLDGQLAVSNVMQNRAASNYGGYGNDILSQALAPNQFQGQTTPTPQSMAVAWGALNGENANIVPGSMQYAAPVGTTNPTALAALASGNGTQIGGNTFFTTFQGAANGETLSGSGPVGDAGQPATSSNLPTSGYMSAVSSSTDPNNPTPIGANSSLPIMASGQQNTNYTDPTAAPAVSNPGDTPPSPGTGMLVQDQGLTGTVAAMASAIAKAITGVGNAQDKTAQNDTTAQDKTAQASTYSLVGALSGIGNAAFANVFDIFGRSALLATGLILMIGAILFTMKSGGSKIVPTL